MDAQEQEKPKESQESAKSLASPATADSWDKWVRRITNPALVNLVSLFLGTAGVLNELIIEDEPRAGAIPFIGFFLSTPLIRFGDSKIKAWKGSGDLPE